MEVRKAKKAMARRRDEPARTEMGLGWPCNPKGANGKPRIGSSANEQEDSQCKADNITFQK